MKHLKNYIPNLVLIHTQNKGILIAIFCSFAASLLGVINNALGKYIGSAVFPLHQTMIKTFWAFIFLTLLFSWRIRRDTVLQLPLRQWITFIVVGIFSWVLSRWAILEATLRIPLSHITLIEAVLPIIIYVIAIKSLSCRILQSTKTCLI